METKKSIIHIFHDDKFVDIAIDIFEKNQNAISNYIVLIPNTNHQIRYVKTKDVELVSYDMFNDLAIKLNSYPKSLIFLHGFGSDKRMLLRMLDDKHLFVWFMWGYDFYNTWNCLKNKLFLPITKKYYSKGKSLKERFLDSYFSYNIFLFINSINHKILRFFKLQAIFNTHLKYYNDVNKISDIVLVIPHERKLVKRLKIPMNYHHFSYGSIKQLIGENNYNSRFKEQNILVGNSASPVNNHLDVFKILSKKELKGEKIIVPLSYGGNREYVELVTKWGVYYFGEKFHPIIDFIPMSDYNNILSSCKLAIFSSIRQHAINNILTSIFVGAQVVLHEKNPVYTYYKSLGLQIMSIGEFMNVSSIHSMIDFDKAKNKKILAKEYSDENIQQKVDLLINSLNP